jgi:chromosome segregation ATPase
LSDCDQHDTRIRSLEVTVSRELGNQEQFRHDIRNWRTAIDGFHQLFQNELLAQSNRIGALEQYRARHEAEYRSKMDEIHNLHSLEDKLTGKIDELKAAVDKVDDRVSAVIIEKANDKTWIRLIWAFLGGSVAVAFQIIGHKVGWL